MSVRRLAPADQQPASFAFTAENLAWAKQQIAKYPDGRQASAVIPILWRAQEQAGGWVPQAAIETVADLLGMARIRVLEVATFYTQFQLAPIGRKAHVQLCGTTPCMLRGAEDLKKVCERRIHHHPFQISADGDFSWEEVECLGACVNAPMVMIDRDTYEDLTPELLEKVLDGFKSGAPPRPGPQNGRQFSAPLGGEIALKHVATTPAVTAPVAPAPAAAAPAAAAPVPATPVPIPATAPAAGDAEALAAAEEADIKAKLATLQKDASPEQKADAVGSRPAGLVAARDGTKDDLQRIKGIGPVNETRLNALGIFHFDQIARWTRPEIRWVGTYLAFPGRIDREHWVHQAAALAADVPPRTGKA